MSFRSNKAKWFGAHVARERLLLGLLGALVMSAGCDRGDDRKQDDQSQQVLDRALEEQAQKQAAEEAKRKRDSEEASKKQAAEEAAQAKVAQSAQEKLLSCCEALGKLGFENRSMEYMKGYDVCEAARQQDKTLPDILEAVRTAIAKNALPEPCSSK